MLVQYLEDQTLVKVIEPENLFDPAKDEVKGKKQADKAEQTTQEFKKSQLIFPSGESLPKC